MCTSGIVALLVCMGSWVGGGRPHRTKCEGESADLKTHSRAIVQWVRSCRPAGASQSVWGIHATQGSVILEVEVGDSIDLFGARLTVQAYFRIKLA